MHAAITLGPPGTDAHAATAAVSAIRAAIHPKFGPKEAKFSTPKALRAALCISGIFSSVRLFCSPDVVSKFDFMRTCLISSCCSADNLDTVSGITKVIILVPLYVFLLRYLFSVPSWAAEMAQTHASENNKAAGMTRRPLVA